MLKTTSARRPNLKSVMTASLTALIAMSCTNLSALSAPTSRVLTPAEFAQRKAAYERYTKYVQATLAQQQQQQHSQKLLQKKQVEKKEAEADAAAAAASGKPAAPKTARKRAPIPREDVLLVMPAAGAKADDIKETIESNRGEICGRLGAGGLGVILVKAPHGKVVELQRALAADTKDFKYVDFNRKSVSNFIPTSEPTFSKSWHLMRMHVPDAWDEVSKYNRFPMPLAVFDTGTQGFEAFIDRPGANVMGSIANDKIDDLGFDFNGFLGTGLFSDSIKDQEDDIIHIGNYIKTMTYGCIDTHGHGTWVGTTISGSYYNGMGSAGINPQVPVYPVKIADGPAGKPAYTDELACVKAMCVMYDCLGTRIINISYGDMMNARSQPILHEFFKDWYNRKNGLIFCSAGNAGENLSMANQPYINCVSAMDHKDGMVLVNGKSWQSASGTAVDFTAPGQDITVCNPNNTANTVNGTSFSSPIVAGIASMIWTINPNLKNTEVEKILRDSCENTGGANTWNPQFGWGMPDALKACKAAEAGLK